jgi:hypothetical protein
LSSGTIIFCLLFFPSLNTTSSTLSHHPMQCHSVSHFLKPFVNGCARFGFPSLLSHLPALSYTMSFDIKTIHQSIPTTCSHASHRRYCNVDFVSFHDVTCYTNALLSCIYVNITNLLNITCTSVATCMVSGGLQYLDIYIYI